MIMLRFIRQVMVNMPHENNIIQDGVKQNIMDDRDIMGNTFYKLENLKNSI